MKEVKTIKVYNLLNKNGDELRLNLGMLQNRRGEVYLDDPDEGWRWSFEGKEIPMPVRSGYWFNGFPAVTMLEWLKGNGWTVRTCVDMCTGKAIVYELPSEPSKGNETYELSDVAIRSGEAALKIAIKSMCDDGFVLRAITLYRLAHPCSLVDAKHAVDAIRFPDDQT